MFSLSQVSKSFGTNAVLADISFSLEKGQKAALVGSNGVGKSTLMKIIAGLEEADGGKVVLQKDCTVGYLPQEAGLISEQTIQEYLAGGQDGGKEHRLSILLAGFGMEKVSLKTKISEMSGGQKTKISLIKLLLQDPDLLLLDEPTNNLDIPALIWLEDFLKKTQSACLIISHDRRFLDSVADKIIEIDRQARTVTINSGTYSAYIENSLHKQRSLEQQYEKQQEEFARLTTELRRQKDRAESKRVAEPTDNDKFLRGFKSDRIGKKAGNRVRAVETRIEHGGELERPKEYNVLEISLESVKKRDHGVLDIRLEDVVAGYEGFTLGPINLSISFGQRVGMLGLNGSGKSTLLKVLTGILPSKAGVLSVGSGVHIGNLTQEHEGLPQDKTVFDFLEEKTALESEHIYNILQKYGFSEVQIKHAVGALSSGGKARLLFALFSLLKINTLILDEPTNHLDSEASQALEQALATYTGTVILASHDRYFLEKARLSDTYILSEGKLERIPDYSHYVKTAEIKAKKLLRVV